MKKCVVLAVLFFLSVALPAQERGIKNLVFEGAGIRGIAYCGAILELEERGMMTGIEKVGGTSAGAMMALCLSLGYSSTEISDLLYSTNFKKFNDGRFLLPGGVNRVSKYFGWYRGQKLTRWLEAIIAKKTGDPNITFEELYTKGFKDLYVTATVLNEQRMVVLSRKTYPQMRVKDAVRISGSIPLYFEAVLVDKQGHVSRSPRNPKGLDVMVDGGFIANFPIRIFDSIPTGTGMEPVITNSATLGFRIDSEKQIEYDREGKGLAGMPITGFKGYLRAFYTIMLENLNRQLLLPDDWKRTVSISDGGFSPRIRKLAKTEIETLVENGRVATKKYFSQ